MAEAVTRTDRIRRGFNRLGWLVLAVFLMLALLMVLVGAYQGNLAGEARVLALLALVVALGGMIVARALGWVISGFFPDS
jgi:uncharacterized membrane protein YiaA